MFTENGYKKLARLQEMAEDCRGGIEVLIDVLGKGDVHSVSNDDLFLIGSTFDRLVVRCNEAYSLSEECWDEIIEED